MNNPGNFEEDFQERYHNEACFVKRLVKIYPVVLKKIFIIPKPPIPPVPPPLLKISITEKIPYYTKMFGSHFFFTSAYIWGKKIQTLYVYDDNEEKKIDDNIDDDNFRLNLEL